MNTASIDRLRSPRLFERAQVPAPPVFSAASMAHGRDVRVRPNPSFDEAIERGFIVGLRMAGRIRPPSRCREAIAGNVASFIAL